MAKMNQVHGSQHTTLDGDRHSMGLHGESIEVIMTMLTNLYADPIMAVIREYAVNAIDSHIEAGNSNPIVVTLPTSTKPTFTIQDFGVGLTTQEVIDLFGLYGNSTKRNSDEVTGMLGVGSKSGLTYSNSFTVVSVKNGIQTTALISKNDRGIGQIDIVDTVSTNLANGVSIQIPVAFRDVDDFINKAEHFFSFWHPGEYLLDGRTVKQAHANGTFAKVGNMNVYVGPSGYYTKKVVVMGHVPYAVNSDILDKVLGNNGMIAYLNIGEVQFAPSREELTYSNMTNKALSNLAQGIQTSAQATVDGILSKCTTKAEAYKAKQDAVNADFFAQYADWVWNGWTIPDDVRKLDKAAKTCREFSINRYYHGRGTNDWSQASVTNASDGSTVGTIGSFIVNNAPKSIPNWLKDSIKDNVVGKGHGIDPDVSLVSITINFYNGDLTTEENFDFLPVVEFSTISALCPKPAKTSVNGVAIDKTSHNYEVIRFEDNNRWMSDTCRRVYTGTYVTELPDADEAQFVVTQASDNDKAWMKTQAYAQASETKTYIVQVNKRSLEDFENAGYAITDHDSLVNEAKARIAKISKEQLEAWIVSNYAPDWVRHFNGQPNAELLDPDVQAVLESYRKAQKEGALVGTLTEHDRDAALNKNKLPARYWYQQELAEKQLPKCQQIQKRYGVLDLHRTCNSDDIKAYIEAMNAIYTYRKDNS